MLYPCFILSFPTRAASHRIQFMKVSGGWDVPCTWEVTWRHLNECCAMSYS